MPNYSVDFSYMTEAFGSTTVVADDEEQANFFAQEYVNETYPEAFNVVIDEVKLV